MIVNMWMTRELVTIEPGASITEAAGIMAKRGIRQLPVLALLQGHLQLVGLVSAADLFRAFPADVNPFAVTVAGGPPSERTVDQIMTRQLFTVTPDTPIEEAARMMRDHDVSALPVVRGHALVGMIANVNVFAAFISFFDGSAGGIRITFDVSKGEDIFGMLAGTIGKRDARVLSLMSSAQDQQLVCAVRLVGSAVDDVLNEIWSSGHHVRSVVRLP